MNKVNSRRQSSPEHLGDSVNLESSSELDSDSSAYDTDTMNADWNADSNSDYD